MIRTAIAAVLGLALLVPTALNGQIVYGRITDVPTGLPVTSANVTLTRIGASDSITVVTDSLGVYRVLANEPGRHMLSVKRLGYLQSTSDPFDLAEDDQYLLNLRLTPQGIELPEIEVTTTRPGLERGRFAFARRCALETGLCLNRDSVALREPRVVLDALRGIEGLFSGSLRPVSGECLKIFVNNLAIPVFSTVPQRTTFDVNMLNPESVMGIEVYLEYRDIPREMRESLIGFEVLPRPGSRNWRACGAILIWTREAW